MAQDTVATTAEERLEVLAAMPLEAKIDQVLLIMWQCQEALESLASNPMARAMGMKLG